jgi:hypothetical protein
VTEIDNLPQQDSSELGGQGSAVARFALSAVLLRTEVGLGERRYLAGFRRLGRAMLPQAARRTQALSALRRRAATCHGDAKFIFVLTSLWSVPAQLIRYPHDGVLQRSCSFL